MKKNFLLLCGCFLMALESAFLTGCSEEEITPPTTITIITPETPQLPEKGSIILSDESMEYLSENNTLQITFSYPAQQKTLSFTANIVTFFRSYARCSATFFFIFLSILQRFSLFVQICGQI